MIFFTAFKATSQDILEQVGQEVALEDVEKGAKSEYLKYRDGFISYGKKERHRHHGQCNLFPLNGLCQLHGLQHALCR